MKRLAGLILALAAQLGAQTVFFNAGVFGRTASDPTFSPAAGTYTGTQNITLSTVTAGATICYRTDGVNPAATVAGTCDAGSSTYTSAISLAPTQTTTVKAIATKSGQNNSLVASATYTINQGPPTLTGQGCQVHGATNSTNCTITGVTSGNSLLIIVMSEGNRPISTLTDSTGQTLTQDAHANVNTTTRHIYFYHLSSANSGSHTITASIPSSSTNELLVYEVAGAASSPMDVAYTGMTGTVSCSASTNGGLWTIGTITTTLAEDLVIGTGLDQSSAAAVVTAGSGFSGLAQSTRPNVLAMSREGVTATGYSMQMRTSVNGDTCYGAGIAWKHP
jgi:hypothetical protein